MLKEKNIDIYFFTGTGNTYLIVKEIKEQLVKRGKNVNIHRIEKSEAKEINCGHVIGLAFPVAIQSTFPLVWDFVYRMPNVTNIKTKVFMIDTMQAFSGGVVGPLKKVLIKKGYNCIGAREFVMPSNYNKIAMKRENDIKIQKSLTAVDEFVDELLGEKTNWSRIPVLSDLMRSISRSDSIWKKTQNQITINEEKCIKCGICAKLCPIENIKFEKGSYPIKENKCQSCMRCVHFCPRKAILFKNKEPHQYRAVDVNFFLD